MKKKILLVALVLVALASTIGVGFASWVISRPAEESISGQFYVEQVTEDNLGLLLSFVDKTDHEAAGPGYFSFYGPSANADQTGKWLTYDVTTAEGRVYANTTVVVKIQVVTNYVEAQGNELASYQNATSAYKVHLTFDEGTTSDNVFTAQNVASKSIDQATASSNNTAIANLLSGANFSVEEDNSISAVSRDNTGLPHWGFDVTTDTDGVAYLHIDYAFGSHFNYGSDENAHTNVNPFEFYNLEGKTADADADEASAVLSAIYSQVSGVSFKLSLKVSASDIVTSGSGTE